MSEPSSYLWWDRETLRTGGQQPYLRMFFTTGKTAEVKQFSPREQYDGLTLIVAQCKAGAR